MYAGAIGCPITMDSSNPREPAMVCRWLILTAIMLSGCTREPRVATEYEPPRKIDTDFARLPSILKGIRETEDISLYEGLPSEFWTPQLREQERTQKKTITLHGYQFYEQRITPQAKDSRRLTSILSARKTFVRYQRQKPCGGFQPDYGIQWKTGEAITEVLISLECGEVKMFGPQCELHCDLSREAGQELKRLLGLYQKNRPAETSNP